MTYVGDDKVINKVERYEVIFHAKRAIQELHYDELREIEVSNNTDIVFDKVKDSNIANLLSSDYKENSEFIEGSLERDYDFKIEDVNYLANVNETETSITPNRSKKSSKIDYLAINFLT